MIKQTLTSTFSHCFPHAKSSCLARKSVLLPKLPLAPGLTTFPIKEKYSYLKACRTLQVSQVTVSWVSPQ